jgi:hypothetical protein
VESTEFHIPAKDVKSLCWVGDVLVDWVSGGDQFHLDGRCVPRHVAYSFPFDAAVVSPSGEYAVIYTKLGTKGLLLRRGQIVREINRSFYHAHAYEYPVALLRLRTGQELLAHCPEDYCQLEIEELSTGRRLTQLDTRQPSDFFFSRLAADADGDFLLSAGWHWHPVDHVKVFKISNALADPTHLDGKGLDLDTWADHSSACFTSSAYLVVALSNEVYDDEDEDKESAQNGERKEKPQKTPFGKICIFELNESKLLSTIYPEAMVGTMMPVGEEYVVGFYEHPKLFSLQTGRVVQSWPQINSGNQLSSIIWHKVVIPPMALDPVNRRFAVASESEITVVQFEKSR